MSDPKNKRYFTCIIIIIYRQYFTCIVITGGVRKYVTVYNKMYMYVCAYDMYVRTQIKLS